MKYQYATINRAPSSEFVSSSSPSWQTLTAHVQTFRGARDLAFCLKVPLDSLLVWASSKGSGETARIRRLAWTFAARIGDKYQIRLARPNRSWDATLDKNLNMVYGRTYIWTTRMLYGPCRPRSPVHKNLKPSEKSHACNRDKDVIIGYNIKYGINSKQYKIYLSCFNQYSILSIYGG